MKRNRFALCMLGIVTLFSRAQSAVVEPAWVQNYDGPAAGPDGAVAVAVDDNGSVFVTGTSAGVGSGSDYATIKYSSDGVALWTNRYSGSGNGNDGVVAMVLDGNDNVYVTGYRIVTNSHAEYATLKYSSSGQPLWTNCFHEPGTANSDPGAMAVDSENAVIVTGRAYAAETGLGYATIKYSPAGEAMWTNHHFSPGAGLRAARAIAVDRENGDIFVTGHLPGPDNTADYVTLKYSSAGGSLWTNRYSQSSCPNNLASSIALDRSGNVFVTGISSETETTATFITTIKYSNAGVPLWTNQFVGPAGWFFAIPESWVAVAPHVAVDDEANIFVAGISFGSDYRDRFVTLKYSNDGALIWTNHYSAAAGALPSWDQVKGIALDGDGNVLVAGQSAGKCATVAYSNAGVPLWTNLFDGAPGNPAASVSGQALVATGRGSVLVAGSITLDPFPSGLADYFTIKYSSVSVRLGIELLEGSVVLSWSDSAFGLQSAPDPGGTFTNVPGVTSPYTHTLSGTRQFFRLKAN